MVSHLFYREKRCFMSAFILEQNLAYKTIISSPVLYHSGNSELYKKILHCTIVIDYLMQHAYVFSTATTTNTDESAALANRIEVLVASIKRRSKRLYKDADSNKSRARVRRKIREERRILSSFVDKYNGMVQSTESLCLETILSVEAAWPWQLPHSGRYTSLLKRSCKCGTSVVPEINLQLHKTTQILWMLTFLMYEFFFGHKCFPDSVDFRTKRRAFDIVMSVRRLQEEKKILVTEMNHHWKSLSARRDSLKELSCLVTSVALQGICLKFCISWMCLSVSRW